MAKFITARVRPKATTTAASDLARRRTRPRAPSPARITAAVHSRTPVTAAGGTTLNSLAARPAPTRTDTMPDRTSAGGGTAPSRPLRRTSPRTWPTPAGPFRACPADLLPAEHPRGHADPDDRPDQQHGQVAQGQPAAVLQHRVQPVGQRAGRQQPQPGLGTGR